MNQFIYLINNRTGCKVKCINPAFQSKLNSLIVQLEKLLVQLKNNGRSPSLDNQLRNVLNQVLVLLNGNRNQSKNKSKDINPVYIFALLILLISKLIKELKFILIVKLLKNIQNNTINTQINTIQKLLS